MRQLWERARPPRIFPHQRPPKTLDRRIIERKERGVSCRLRQTLVRHDVEHVHGIMRGKTPKRVVEASKNFTRFLMPGPPEVQRQWPQSADPRRQVTLRPVTVVSVCFR
jgi:hypothetical protein